MQFTLLIPVLFTPECPDRLKPLVSKMIERANFVHYLPTIMEACKFIVRSQRPEEDAVIDVSYSSDQNIKASPNNPQYGATIELRGISFAAEESLEPTISVIKVVTGSIRQSRYTSFIVGVKASPFVVEDAETLLKIARKDSDQLPSSIQKSVLLKSLHLISRALNKLVSGDSNTKKTLAMTLKSGIKTNLAVIKSEYRNDPERLAEYVNSNVLWNFCPVFTNYDVQKLLNDDVDLSTVYKIFNETSDCDLVILDEMSEKVWYCSAALNTCEFRPFSALTKFSSSTQFSASLPPSSTLSSSFEKKLF